MTSMQNQTLPFRRPTLTEEEKREIIALREKGWGLERLAEKFNCHVGPSRGAAL